MSKRRLQWGFNAAGVRKDSRALTADEHAFVEERLARGLRFAAIAPMLGMSEPDLQRAYGVVVQEMPEVVSRASREAAIAKRRASRYAESRQERALTTWQAKKPANIAREGER